MYCDQITFVIFTFNEAARVERAVRNFIRYGRVLVVDNHSTDHTVDIARALGAEVLLHKNTGWVEDEATTNKVLNFVQTPWVYWGYADEMVEGHTIRKLLSIIKGGQHKVISLARKNYYFGKSCHEAYAGRLTRVFQKNAIDFSDNKIHHFGKLIVNDDEIISLSIKEHVVHHFISNTTKSYLHTNDRYTDIDSKTAPQKSVLFTVLQITKTFLANYLVRGAYKAGMAGLFMSIQTALYQLLLAMKSYEFHENINIKEIEIRNNVIRDKILFEIK